jgi:uncharacterized iron-regulated membrane protein
MKKKILFDIHSWIGIKLSILFFIVCFSGTLATLSHEMDWLFIPDIRVSETGEKVSKNLMVKNLQSVYPDSKLEFWQGAQENYLCDIVFVKKGERQVYAFVNPYTGAVQGHATITFQRFFRDLHYYLFIPFQYGHFTVLVFAFLLLISCLTALLFYKKWYRKLFELKTKNGSLVFFRSLHRLVGVWSVPFTLLFSVTGIWYFIERTNIANVSDIANPRQPKFEYSGQPISSEIDFSFSVDYSLAETVAKTEIPGLQVKDIVPPAGPDEVIYLTGTSDVPLVRSRANRVYLDPLTYKVLGVQRAKDLNTITYLNDIADPIHFGTWGGLLTKFIWFIFGLGISSLVLSGIWISLKRKVKTLAKQQKQRMGIWKYINWLIFLILIGFMYNMLISTYHASVLALATVTGGWMIFIAAAWYLFVYKLKKVVDKEMLNKNQSC